MAVSEANECAIRSCLMRVASPAFLLGRPLRVLDVLINSKRKDKVDFSSSHRRIEPSGKREVIGIL